MERIIVVKDKKQKDRLIQRLLKKKGRVIAIVKDEKELENDIVKSADVVIIDKTN